MSLRGAGPGTEADFFAFGNTGGHCAGPIGWQGLAEFIGAQVGRLSGIAVIDGGKHGARIDCR